MNAKAAVFMGKNEPFEVREFPVTTPPSGFAQMELIASGICGTDLHMHNGKLGAAVPSIIGHEFVGRIVDTDTAQAAEYGLAVGDAVIADIAMPCGECILCQSGDDANCVKMRVTSKGDINEAPHMRGGYTEMNYTPLTNLIKIPASVDPVVAATFACPGPTVIHACGIAKRANIDLENVGVAVVQGLGPVGMFAVMYLKQIGVKTVYAITAGNNAEREQTALTLGATEVFNLTALGAEEVTKRLKSENGGIGVDLCFEASGAPQAVSQGLDILRNRGVYLIPGQYSASGSIELHPQVITFRALQILGSSQYSLCDVHAYVKFLEERPQLHGEIHKLSSRYTIDQINEAIADAKSGNNIKTLLVK